MPARKSDSEGRDTVDQTDGRALTAWERVTAQLAAVLESMEDGLFLILTHPRTGSFVQFAGQRDGILRAEAVSNVYLAPEARLSAEAEEQLALLGWHAPTHDDATEQAEGAHPEFGSTNYYLDLHPPVRHLDAAVLAIRTLAGVYGVRRPGELRHTAFRENGPQIWYRGFAIKPEEG